MLQKFAATFTSLDLRCWLFKSWCCNFIHKQPDTVSRRSKSFSVLASLLPKMCQMKFWATFWNWFFCSCVGPWCIIVCLIYVQMGYGFLKFWFIVRRYQFIRYITLPSTSSIFSYFHFLYTCVHCNWNSKFWRFMYMQKITFLGISGK